MKEECPHCKSKIRKKNGHTHYGKQNHQCNECGPQFVEGGQDWFISESVKELIDRFSKTLNNHIGAIKYFLCHYNLEVKALHL